MDISRFLSKVIGIYLIIVSLAMFLNLHEFIKYIYALITNSALMFTLSIFTLLLGILMVVAHNIWEWHWRVIITILGWLTLIKGASVLFFPQMINVSMMPSLETSSSSIIIGGIINLTIGILLTYLGFRKV